MPGKAPYAVDVRPWSNEDLPLLKRLMGDPATAEPFGGPEGPQQTEARHERYLQGNRTRHGMMFAMLAGPRQQAAGAIGYWERVWRGQHMWEIGWSVLPEFEGQGVAARAAELVVQRARAGGQFRFLHAFPHIDDVASNAVCRNLGFTLEGQIDFDASPDHPTYCNDWRLDLFGGAEGADY